MQVVLRFDRLCMWWLGQLHWLSSPCIHAGSAVQGRCWIRGWGNGRRILRWLQVYFLFVRNRLLHWPWCAGTHRLLGSARIERHRRCSHIQQTPSSWDQARQDSNVRDNGLYRPRILQVSRCDQLFKLLKNHMEPHMISYYDILWHITTYFDVVCDSMTWLYIQLHHLDLDSRRDATFRPRVLRCSEMLCDIVRCDVMLRDILWCLAVFWDVVWCCECEAQTIIWFIHVHSYNVTVTDPDRLLEPFSGSEVQWCARWSCGYLESSSLELRK